MIKIRDATRTDVDQLWGLMRDLAVFEKYLDAFAITPDIVRASGFEKSPPDFHALVADDAAQLHGMLVYYFLPYTTENRPAVYIKELFVTEPARGRGVGSALMQALKQIARKHHCTCVKWTVAPWNEAGIRFYEKLGARQNADWLNFEWQI